MEQGSSELESNSRIILKRESASSAGHSSSASIVNMRGIVNAGQSLDHQIMLGKHIQALKLFGKERVQVTQILWVRLSKLLGPCRIELRQGAVLHRAVECEEWHHGNTERLYSAMATVCTMANLPFPAAPCNRSVR